MKTKVLKIDAAKDSSDAIKEAAAIVDAGGLVAFPTETVYGLGADASNPEALKKFSTQSNVPLITLSSFMSPIVRN